METKDGAPVQTRKRSSSLGALLGRMFRWKLYLYPKRFRETFGEEMEQAFSLRVQEIGAKRGGAWRKAAAVAILVFRTWLDTVKTALSERLRSSLPEPSRDKGFRNPGVQSLRPKESPGFQMDSVIQDLRFSFRALRRRPLFSLIAVSTLGLGIGSAASVFSVVDGVLVRPLPYDDPETLVTVTEVQRPSEVADENQIPGTGLPFAWQAYLTLREGVSLMDVAVFMGAGEMPLTGSGTPEQLSVGYASANLFDLLGVRFHLGRGFLSGEDGTAPGQAARVTILSHELWGRRFGENPSLLGSTITLNETPYTVVGILPPGFRLQSEIVTVVGRGTDLGLRDLWVPIGQTGVGLQSDGNAFEVLGRLASGVTPAQARTEADAVLATVPDGRSLEARIFLRKEVVTKGFAAPLIVMLAGAGLLLLIACANVALLTLSEAPGRRHEIATRSALGAGRGRISRQLLTESVLLGMGGSLVGILLAVVGTDVLLSLAPPIPRLEEVGVNSRVLAFAVGSGLTTGLVFGLAPLGMLLSSPVGQVLARRFRGSSERGGWLQAGAVVSQFALTVVLLVVGGLFARSLLAVGEVDPGFRPENVATLRVNVPAGRYPTQVETRSYFEAVLEELRAVPGVESVGGSYGLPFPGGAPRNALELGRPGSESRVSARRRTVLPQYHETLGIPLISGRFLSTSDEVDRAGAMVVSESLARRLWEDESPVGATVGFWGTQWTIVGVVGDVRHTDLASEGEPTFYVPFAQAPRRNLNLVIRTAGDPVEAVPYLREAVWRVDPDMPLTEVGTLGALVEESTAGIRYRTFLILVLGFMASMIAAVGVFGLTARSVAKRSRELGIRRALGAKHGELVLDSLRRGLLHAIGGILAGLAVAVAVGHVLSHFLFGVEATDPLTHGLVACALLLVATTATLFPALRVTRVMPMAVLREE